MTIARPCSRLRSDIFHTLFFQVFCDRITAVDSHRTSLKLSWNCLLKNHISADICWDYLEVTEKKGQDPNNIPQEAAPASSVLDTEVGKREEGTRIL